MPLGWKTKNKGKLRMAYYLLPYLRSERFAPEISHAVGIAFPVFTSYLGHKHWSFC
jgi:hypothetical protein